MPFPAESSDTIPLLPISVAAQCFNGSLDWKQGHPPCLSPAAPVALHQMQLILTGAWKASTSHPSLDRRKWRLRQTSRGASPTHQQRVVGLELEAESCLSGLMLPQPHTQLVLASLSSIPSSMKPAAQPLPLLHRPLPSRTATLRAAH